MKVHVRELTTKNLSRIPRGIGRRIVCRKSYRIEGTTRRVMVANDSQRLERVQSGMQCMSKGRKTQQKGRDVVTTTSYNTGI
jgi:hypothetical protein